MKSRTAWLAAVSAAFLCACSTPPTAGGERVIVFLKARPGAEKGLLDVTREWMAKVRKVPGLDYADVNVQNDDPGTIVMYYHWRTKDYAEAYRHTDLYKQAGVALQPYVADRRIVQTTNMDQEFAGQKTSVMPDLIWRPWRVPVTCGGRARNQYQRLFKDEYRSAL